MYWNQWRRRRGQRGHVPLTFNTGRGRTSLCDNELHDWELTVRQNLYFFYCLQNCVHNVSTDQTIINFILALLHVVSESSRKSHPEIGEDHTNEIKHDIQSNGCTYKYLLLNEYGVGLYDDMPALIQSMLGPSRRHF